MKPDVRALTDRSTPKWKDWRWQQRNAVRDVRQLADYFTAVPKDFFEQLGAQNERLKFQLTPYMLSQFPADVPLDELLKNPWFLQFFPLGEVYTEGHDAYNKENWEMTPEFPTRDLQHKYTNRLVVRFRECLAYCSFCFEALGTLERDSKKKFLWSDWKGSLAYIASHPDLEEVILSGGEPLLVDDEKLEGVFKDITSLKREDGKQKVRFKRIHTRVLTHNPYRVTDKLVRILRDYMVNEIALNVAHPLEITSDFKEAVYKIREGTGRYAPLIVTHTPLLRGVNVDAAVLWELFGRLYELNIKPYYLLHSMPHTPFADRTRVSVRDGVRLMKTLKRHKSNIAIPEFVIPQYDGKQTVPLEINGTPEFQYCTDEKGNPIVKFFNWRNKWVTYPDCKDTLK